MKITVNYGNSATINTGVPYESMKPFYNISWECELPVNSNKEEITSMLIEKAKSIVDEKLFKDMKFMNDIRKKCVCKPEWNKEINKMVHKPDCFMSKVMEDSRG